MSVRVWLNESTERNLTKVHSLSDFGGKWKHFPWAPWVPMLEVPKALVSDWCTVARTYLRASELQSPLCWWLIEWNCTELGKLRKWFCCTARSGDTLEISRCSSTHAAFVQIHWSQSVSVETHWIHLDGQTSVSHPAHIPLLVSLCRWGQISLTW